MARYRQVILSVWSVLACPDHNLKARQIMLKAVYNSCYDLVSLTEDTMLKHLQV